MAGITMQAVVHYALDPSPLVGRIEPLERWRTCFEEMDRGTVVKSVLKL